MGNTSPFGGARSRFESELPSSRPRLNLACRFRPLHMRTYVRVMPREGPRYTEEEARRAIAESLCWAQALRRLGVRPAGGHHKTIKKWAGRWQISTAHFDANAARRTASRARGRLIEDLLVAHSTYARGHLKARLYEAGLKQRVCELCGQDEHWHGRRMALILDHVNGIPDDNRLENLRIICPNCAATLETHCGRNIALVQRACAGCGEIFTPRYQGQRFCSPPCWHAADKPYLRTPHPEKRKVARPPYKDLIAELEATSYVAVGRKYGVSDNAVRKWVRWYESDAERSSDRAGR